jgi:hypothetical protein
VCALVGGANTTLLLVALFAKRKTKFGGGGKKLESESEGGQKFLFPDPFPFCPPERKTFLKVRIGIFRKKSSNFVQKAPQFFKINVFEVGGLGASRRKVEIFQYFPSVFEIKIQFLLGNLEVRLSEAQSKTKFCKPIFFLSAVGGNVKR